jgi:hypothetical protein
MPKRPVSAPQTSRSIRSRRGKTPRGVWIIVGIGIFFVLVALGIVGAIVFRAMAKPGPSSGIHLPSPPETQSGSPTTPSPASGENTPTEVGLVTKTEEWPVGRKFIRALGENLFEPSWSGDSSVRLEQVFAEGSSFAKASADTSDEFSPYQLPLRDVRRQSPQCSLRRIDRAARCESVSSFELFSSPVPLVQ